MKFPVCGCGGGGAVMAAVEAAAFVRRAVVHVQPVVLGVTPFAALAFFAAAGLVAAAVRTGLLTLVPAFFLLSSFVALIRVGAPGKRLGKNKNIPWSVTNTLK